MTPLQLAAVSWAVVLLIAGCARLPPASPAPDLQRVQHLLAERADTLHVRPSDYARYADSDAWHETRRHRDSLRADGTWAGSVFLAHLDRRVAASDPDSLERAYRAGIRDALADLARGQFRFKVLGLWPVVQYDGDDTAWCTLAAYASVLRREYGVEVDRVAGDVLDGQGVVAYADGYNRTSAPVIDAYWGGVDVRARARDRVEVYVSREGDRRREEWSAGC